MLLTSTFNNNINKKIEIFKSNVLCKYGNPVDIWKELISEYEISNVFFNRDYEPYAIKRDQEIINLLDKNNIKTSTMLSHNKNTNDYSKHISTLGAAGGDALAIISDTDLGGDQIIKSMLDTGMFNVFILSENMINEKIINNFKEKNLKKDKQIFVGLVELMIFLNCQKPQVVS